jgi:hypothetical protein
MTSHSNPQVSHLNLALTQALAQNNSRISSLREWRRSIGSSRRCCVRGEPVESEDGLRGYKYQSPKK